MKLEAVELRRIRISLVAPFENLLPPLPYNGYTIDVSTLIAILVYAIGITVVRQFLKVLAGR